MMRRAKSSNVWLAGWCVLFVLCGASASPYAEAADPPSSHYKARHLDDGTIELIVFTQSPALKQVDNFSMDLIQPVKDAAAIECPGGYEFPKQDQTPATKDSSGRPGHLTMKIRRIVRCK